MSSHVDVATHGTADERQVRSTDSRTEVNIAVALRHEVQVAGFVGVKTTLENSGHGGHLGLIHGIHNTLKRTFRHHNTLEHSDTLLGVRF